MNMKKFFFGMSVDDVTLAHWCKVENFRKLIDFLDLEKIPATFFVVPVDEESGKPFNQLPGDYAGIIRAAHEHGHAFAQHGLSHNRFELAHLSHFGSFLTRNRHNKFFTSPVMGSSTIWGQPLSADSRFHHHFVNRQSAHVDAK